MKNRVVAFTGNRNFPLDEVEKSLLGLGHFDFSYVICKLFEECVGECNQDFDTGIVICDNHDLDRLLESVKKDGDALELLHEQAVSLKRDGKKLLFLPLGLNYESFLKEFLGDFGALVYSVFGKTAGYIQNIFNSIRCDYKIITKSSILHTVYCSSTINPQLLQSAFGENLYSLQNESVASACAKVLEKSGQTLAVAEEFSAGLVCGTLLQACKSGQTNFLKEAHILSSENDLERFGISADFLQEKGIASKETAFEFSKNLIKTSEADLVMTILGENERFFVAIGNKEQIHVFSTIFDGTREENLSNLVDFALFRLMQVVKK